jgi:molybdopterin-containing oxidoreductase family iron-sulfur binding subunit
MENPFIERRGFLKTLIVGLATFGGLRAAQRVSASSPAGSSTHAWAMVIDQSKCTGCGQCTLACRAHNDVSPDISWNRVIQAGSVDHQPIYLARPCMHCEHAPCVEVCMVRASSYRPDGIVAMDYDRCIGCRYCEVACPYNARAFNWEAFTGDNPAVPKWGHPEVPRRPRGVVEKCSFCSHRIDRGLGLGLTPGVDPEATPACVVVCPVSARLFGDLNDATSEVSKAIASHHTYRLREDLGTAPRVYYIPHHEEVST